MLLKFCFCNGAAAAEMLQQLESCCCCFTDMPSRCNDAAAALLLLQCCCDAAMLKGCKLLQCCSCYSYVTATATAGRCNAASAALLLHCCCNYAAAFSFSARACFCNYQCNTDAEVPLLQYCCCCLCCHDCTMIAMLQLEPLVFAMLLLQKQCCFNAVAMLLQCSYAVSESAVMLLYCCFYCCCKAAAATLLFCNVDAEAEIWCYAVSVMLCSVSCSSRNALAN
jgi:hypothetical protein